MNKNESKPKAPGRRIFVVLAYYLAVILVSIILGVTHQIAGWVAQVAIALSLGRLVWLVAWGTAKQNWGWRV